MGPDTRTQVAHGAAAAQPTSHMGPHQRSQRRTWGHISAVNVAYGATSAQSASHSSVDDALGVRIFSAHKKKRFAQRRISIFMGKKRRPAISGNQSGLNFRQNFGLNRGSNARDPYGLIFSVTR